MTHRPERSRGLTLIELLVVVLVISVIVAILTPKPYRARKNAQQLKDRTQLRAIMQGFMQYAAADRFGKYPLPTAVDRINDTEGSPVYALTSTVLSDQHKNRTGAILSIGIYNDLFTPEITVSPMDDGNVRIFDEYQRIKPSGANTPGRAMYDPAFNGTPFDSANDRHCPNNVQNRDDVSHNSYAHSCVAFARGQDWENTSDASTPIWSNRGPAFKDATRTTYDPSNTGWSTLPTGPMGETSNAVLLWGKRGQWQGNVAFADSHVDFAESPQPDGAIFRISHNGAAVDIADNIFVDEHFETDDPNDHALRRNAYLRQWKRGIPTNLDPSEFTYATHLAPTNDATGFAYTD